MVDSKQQANDFEGASQQHQCALEIAELDESGLQRVSGGAEATSAGAALIEIVSPALSDRM